MPTHRRLTCTLALLVALAGAPSPSTAAPLEASFRLDDGDGCRELDVDLARLADGGFVAVWVQGREASGVFELSVPLSIRARLFSADGTPRGPAFRVDGGDETSEAVAPVVAAGGGGGFLVAWVQETVDGRTVLARAYTGDGTAVGAPLEITATHSEGTVDVAPEGAGHRLVWVARGSQVGTPDQVETLTVDASGVASGATILWGLDTPVPVSLSFGAPRIAADEHGFSLVASLTTSVSPTPRLTGRRVEGGILDGPPTELFADSPTGGRHAPAVGTDADGNTVVVWYQASGGHGYQAQVFAPDGATLHGPIWVVGPGRWAVLSDPALTVAGDGSFRVAWAGRRRDASATEGGTVYLAGFDAAGRLVEPERALDSDPVRTPHGVDVLGPADGVATAGEVLVAWDQPVPTESPGGVPPCFTTGIWAQRHAAEPRTELLLHGGRFAVRVDWRDPYSAVERTGSGVAEPLNGESGWFWFFRPGNAELVVKVLDGRPVNGHWWVFHGGLSTVEYEITVTDRDTGATWSYDKPPFTRVSGADTRALPGSAEAAAVSAPGSRRPPSLPSVTAPVDVVHTPCDDIPAGIFPPQGLCLHDRFAVTLDWSDDGAEVHRAPGRRLSDDSGYLWFFRRDNAEVFVKILDGRPVDGHWWLFAGSLTNLPYTLTVEDTVGGTVRTYTGGRGEFPSFVDTRSFP